VLLRLEQERQSFRADEVQAVEIEDDRAAALIVDEVNQGRLEMPGRGKVELAVNFDDDFGAVAPVGQGQGVASRGVGLGVRRQRA
jgi:hypothetical protein